jgi:hypothetical protein
MAAYRARIGMVQCDTTKNPPQSATASLMLKCGEQLGARGAPLAKTKSACEARCFARYAGYDPTTLPPFGCSTWPLM